MTPGPFEAALDQLAACREAIAGLETRESAHFAELTGQVPQLAALITTISRTLPGQLAEPGAGHDGYQPRPAPTWPKLTPGQRRAPVAELRNWVEHVYRPGYGYLATLAPRWPEHDLCLYGLDLASQLWCVLYLQPERTTDLLSAQAEYQVRILPALAAQMTAETTRCGHPAITARPGARP